MTVFEMRFVGRDSSPVQSYFFLCQDGFGDPSYGSLPFLRRTLLSDRSLYAN